MNTETQNEDFYNCEDERNLYAASRFQLSIEEYLRSIGKPVNLNDEGTQSLLEELFVKEEM
mgnify:FL=1